MMRTVPASEFQKNFGMFKEIAQREPVAVTSNGRESVVLISAVEYKEYYKAKQKKETSRTLSNIMDDMAIQAKDNGLTEKKLQALLND